MGQSQSPQKFCARPSSTMFHNNLAQKMKNSAFKKHLSTHAFVRASNLRDIESKYLKSSESEQSQCTGSNMKSVKQEIKKKKQSSFFNNYNFPDTGQGFHLSDIEQNEAEYDDQEKKKINKTNTKLFQKGADKSRKASDEKINLQQSRKQTIQQGVAIEQKSRIQKSKSQSVKQYKQVRVNQEKLKINQEKVRNNQENSHKLSDYDHSNLILFIESKKVQSCNSFEPQIALKSQKSQKGSEFFNPDLKSNSNLQLQSHHSPSKHQQSGTQTHRNSSASIKPLKITRQNEEFKPCNETLIKSRKIPEVCGVEIEQEKLQKTVINSRKAACRDEHSITIKMQNLYKTTHHEQENSKNKAYGQQLFRSCKKVYASQISLESHIQTPQSPSYQQEKQLVRNGVNKAINSKSFQEDFSIKKSSVHERKSHRQKMRESISLGRVRKKLIQSMHNFQLNNHINEDKDRELNEDKELGQKSDHALNDKVEEEGLRRSGSRLGLSSRLRSKICQKLSLSRTHSSRSNVSSQQKLDHSNANSPESRLKKYRLSVRESIKKMHENELMNHLQNTQENYFNQNIDDNTLTLLMYEMKKNKNQDKLKKSIINQTARPSEYEIKANKKQAKKDKQDNSNLNLNKPKNKNSKSKIKVDTIKSTKKLHMFTEDLTEKFQDNTVEKTNYILKPTEQVREGNKNYPQTVQDRKHQRKQESTKSRRHVHKNQQNQHSYGLQITNEEKIQGDKQIQIKQKIQQSKNNDQQYKSPRRTQKNPEEINKSKLSPNYLKVDIQKNHMSLQYSNKKNPQPHDKKLLNHIKFSQLQPNPFDVMSAQKLIKTTSAKNYPYHQDSKIQSCLNLKDSTAKNIEIIDKLINNPVHSRSRGKRQLNRHDDYETFVEELEKLKKIKEMQQKLIQQNLENLKKSNSTHHKVSILDLNKEMINEQITMRVERMDKLKELNKLTKKMDPAMLVKSKSNQVLREEYENLAIKTRLKEKKTDKKHENSFEKDLYYNFSKQMNNLSHLKDYNQVSSSKMIRSLKDLNATSHEYMIDMSKIQTKKHLRTSHKDSLQLACIPESPEIKYHPFKEHENRSSIIKKNQKKRDQYRKEESFGNQGSRSMDCRRNPNLREDYAAVSLQKTTYKKTLIVF